MSEPSAHQRLSHKAVGESRYWTHADKVREARPLKHIYVWRENCCAPCWANRIESSSNFCTQSCPVLDCSYSWMRAQLKQKHAKKKKKKKNKSSQKYLLCMCIIIALNIPFVVSKSCLLLWPYSCVCVVARWQLSHYSPLSLHTLDEWFKGHVFG